MLNKNKQSKIIRQSKKIDLFPFFLVFRFSVTDNNLKNFTRYNSDLALRSLLLNYGSKDPEPTLFIRISQRPKK